MKFETKSNRLTATLTLIVVTLAPVVHAGVGNGLTVGQRQPGDEEIETRMEARRGPPDYVLSYSKTFVGDNHHVITQIVVEDFADGGAYAAIVAGGPGHTYVTLAFTIPRYVVMNYRVSLYGKTPPFRKLL